MLTQHVTGLLAGSGIVMGLLGYTYGVGMGRNMSIVVGVLSGLVMVIAWFYRRLEIK